MRLIIPLPGNEAFALRLADAGRWELGESQTSHFPDGETYIRILSGVKDNAVDLVRTRARLAKLAGKPEAKAAGVYVNVSFGQEIDKGQVMFDIRAEVSGELAYVLEYARRSPDIIEVELSS